jgi:hypothetical protein
MRYPSNFMPQGRLKEATGNPATPITGGFRCILQVVSDQGTYGDDMCRNWSQAESSYRSWYRNCFGKMDKKLGEIVTAQVQSDTAVIHVLAKTGKDEALNYEALRKGLKEAGIYASDQKGNVHMWKLNGDEEKVQTAITEELLKRGVNVTIYSPEPKRT